MQPLANHAHAVLLFLPLLAAPLYADSVVLTPSRDATLFEINGDLANGAGQYLFVGRTNQPANVRALLHFDVTDRLPAGATISSVALRLTMDRTVAGNETATLHRVRSDWTEGSSDAGGQEGSGAAATPGSATWSHAAYDSATWNTPGGDYDPAARATQTIGGNGAYTWSSADMKADVQAWIDNPDSNFGWLLVGNESSNRTAKRFVSREHSSAAARPQLTIEYALPNAAPTVVDTPATVSLYVGTQTAAAVDPAGLFADADGDSLVYGVGLADSGIVAAALAAEGLRLTGIAVGATTVTITATDPSQAAAQISYAAEVHRLPGDFNDSGAVDFDDFFAFADHFGRSGDLLDPTYDLSPNGAVDFDDFFAFADAFGTTVDDDPLGLFAEP